MADQPDPGSPLGRLLAAADQRSEQWAADWLAAGGVLPGPVPWSPAPGQSRADWAAEVAGVRQATDAFGAFQLGRFQELAVELLGESEASGPAPLIPPTAPAIAERRSLTIPATAGRSVGLLVRRPQLDSAGLPCVLYVHCGGFWMGGGEPWRPVSDALLTTVSRLLPAVTVEVDVALAPEQPYPAPIDDLLAALDWVLTHSGELGVDPGRIALAGASSGANTVVAAAIRAPVAALGLWVPVAGPYPLRLRPCRP